MMENSDFFGMLDNIKRMQDKINGIGSANKLIEASQKSMKALGGIEMAIAASKFKLPTTLEYITSPSFQNKMMLDRLAEQMNGTNLALAGNIASRFTGIQEKASILNASEALISGMRTSVLTHSSTYDAFLKATQSFANFVTPTKSLANFENYNKLFTSKNFKENNTLNAFDIASGSTFSSFIKSNKDTNDENLQEQFSKLTDDLEKQPELKKDVQELVSIVADNPRSYQKIDELLTDRLDKITQKFGMTKQQTYLIVLLVNCITAIFASILVKEIISSKSPQITNNITNVIKVVQAPKKTNSCFVTKNAPVYEKSHSTSRRLGTINAFTQVNLIKMKGGWCLVEGVITTLKKEGKLKINKDSLTKCWISQKYIEFQSY